MWYPLILGFSKFCHLWTNHRIVLTRSDIELSYDWSKDKTMDATWWKKYLVTFTIDIALGQKLQSVEFGQKIIEIFVTFHPCEPHPTFGDFELKFLRIRNSTAHFYQSQM